MVTEAERYSFSKLSSFHTCKYGYKLRYIDHLKGIGNCFSSFGKEVHSIMERYAKGEIDLWYLADIYEWEFNTSIPEQFPPNKYCNLRDTYYGQGLSFLKAFDGYDKYKILLVEEAFDHQIDDWIFNGVIDLAYIDENGKLIIKDYKSKAKFNSKKEQSEYARQLYLYSLFIKDKFGRYPDELKFLMFRKNIEVSIQFNIDDFHEALTWAKNTVSEIRNCWDYPPTCEEFYSTNLCNHREYCENKKIF